MVDVETGAGGFLPGDWKVDRFKIFSILVNHIEHIQGLEVNTRSCSYIEALADPARNGLKVTLGKNFVGEPYFVFMYRDLAIFGVGETRHGLRHTND